METGDVPVRRVLADLPSARLHLVRDAARRPGHGGGEGVVGGVRVWGGGGGGGAEVGLNGFVHAYDLISLDNVNLKFTNPPSIKKPRSRARFVFRWALFLFYRE